MGHPLRVSWQLFRINLQLPKRENVHAAFSDERPAQVKPYSYVSCLLGRVTTNFLNWLTNRPVFFPGSPSEAIRGPAYAIACAPYRLCRLAKGFQAASRS